MGVGLGCLRSLGKKRLTTTYPRIVPQPLAPPSPLRRLAFHVQNNETFIDYRDYRERIGYLLLGDNASDAKCQERPEVR